MKIQRKLEAKILIFFATKYEKRFFAQKILTLEHKGGVEK